MTPLHKVHQDPHQEILAQGILPHLEPASQSQRGRGVLEGLRSVWCVCFCITAGMVAPLSERWGDAVARVSASCTLREQGGQEGSRRSHRGEVAFCMECCDVKPHRSKWPTGCPGLLQFESIKSNISYVRCQRNTHQRKPSPASWEQMEKNEKGDLTFWPCFTQP